VNFNLTEHSIVISDQDGNTIFEAVATLNDEGECRLKVTGQEKELWQVRKMALEELFFKKY